MFRMAKNVSFGMNASALRNNTDCKVDLWHENSNIFNFEINFLFLENHIHWILLWWAKRAKRAKQAKQAKQAKRVKQAKWVKQTKWAKQAAVVESNEKHWSSITLDMS